MYPSRVTVLSWANMPAVISNSASTASKGKSLRVIIPLLLSVLRFSRGANLITRRNDSASRLCYKPDRQRGNSCCNGVMKIQHAFELKWPCLTVGLLTITPPPSAFQAACVETKSHRELSACSQ